MKYSRVIKDIVQEGLEELDLWFLDSPKISGITNSIVLNRLVGVPESRARESYQFYFYLIILKK